MVVEIKLLGVFKTINDNGRLHVDVKGLTTVRDVIQKLVTTLPPEFGRTLIDPELNDPRPNALILVRGKEIGVLDGLETKVERNDEIVFIPVSHGG